MGASVLILYIFVIISHASSSLLVQPENASAEVVYACDGGTATLPWNHSIGFRTEFVRYVKWFFHGGNSTDLVAVFTNGQFLPAIKYQGRVSHLQDNGVILRDVTVNDSGTYRIETLISQINSSAHPQIHTYSLYLQVSVSGPRNEVLLMQQSLLDQSKAFLNDIKSELLQSMRTEFLQMQQSLMDRMQVPWNSTKQKVSAEDMCKQIDYITINDTAGLRLTSVRVIEGAEICDVNITIGWYRFLLNGQDATIPTSCTPEFQCSTRATMWIDLMSQSLPAVGREVVCRACASFYSSCCHWERPSVTVRNCGSYYIYRLTPPTHCYLAYCLQ